MKRSSRIAVGVIVLMVTVAFVSSGLTYIALQSVGHAGSGSGVLISREEYDIIRRYRRLDEIWDVVDEYYYKDVDAQTLLTGAARGMLYEIDDPYTFYYTPEEMEELNAETEGKYAGIGCQLIIDQESNLITVTRAFKNSPAEAAGIRSGDKIIAVGDVDVTGYELEKAVSMMKGEPGTDVTITVIMDGVQKEITITRAEILINRVEARMLDGGIGYLQIYEFMGDDVRGYIQAINNFQDQNMRGLIIDLRDNPGGLITDVVDICGTLCPEKLIVYTEDKYGKREEFESHQKQLNVPLVVLVNGMSASASEILAGAVQDYGSGKIVGTQTFGKGIVQTIHTFFSDGAGMRLTTSSYFTPKGRSIHETGITPDVVVELPEELQRERLLLDVEDDPQLQKGIEVLKEMMGEGTGI